MLYVSLAGTHELAVISTEDFFSDQARRTMQPMMVAWPIYPSLGASLWRRIALPGKGPRGLAAAGSKVFVAQYFSDSIASVDFQPAANRWWTRSRWAIPGAHRVAPRAIAVRRRDAVLPALAELRQLSSGRAGGRTELGPVERRSGESEEHQEHVAVARHPALDGSGSPRHGRNRRACGFVHILFSEPPEEDSAAIDVYLKSLRPVPSPYLVDGRLSELAERGRELFHSDRVACHRCHPAPLYTDLRAYDVGTRTPFDRVARFDTPTLVEVWRTAPYLHDGRYTTIRELLIDGRHGLRPSQNLTDDEIDALVEFVLSL
jgi:hypothetical protein